MPVDEFYTWMEWFRLQREKQKGAPSGGGRKAKRRMTR